jgi:hypothetical protein
MDEERPVEEEPTAGQISRRKALKRIGAGAAAAAWSAPLLSSLRTPAFAASPRCGEPPCGSACAPVFPDDFVVCGDVCICVETVEAACACVQLNVGSESCTSSSDCGAGAACVKDTCQGDVCQPLCSSPTVAARTSGATNVRA